MRRIHIVRHERTEKATHHHYTEIIGLYSTYSKAEKVMKDVIATLKATQDIKSETYLSTINAYQYDSADARDIYFIHAKVLDNDFS